MLVFLTPLGAVLALAAALPVAAALVRERRLARVRRVLGLGGPGRRALATSFAAAAAVGLLALAAAQPALTQRVAPRVRTDAQAYVLLDDSRSMEAVPYRGGRSRFVRAQALALGLRDLLSQVPWGVGSFSDRALVHAFPTADRQLFAATVEQSVGIDRPLPGAPEKTATGFGALGDMAVGGFFAPAARKRLVVLFTDAESRPFSARGLAFVLRAHRVHLVVVRLWGPTDRVYGARGRDLGYRPSPESAATAASLQAAGIPVVPERAFGSVPALAERVLGSGPTAPQPQAQQLTPLAPFAVLAAIVPVGFALVRSRR